LARGCPKLEVDVLSLDMAQVAQALPEGCQERIIRARRSREHADDADLA
jgi:hypothetical protein